MAKHLIPITNGKGSKALTNGTYTVEAEILGYDNTSINPNSIEITEGNNSYTFQIAATGTLTLHVCDDGTNIGVPIIGATFKRCDREGREYGAEVISDDSGNAIFNNVPYSGNETPPTIYIKQTSSDGEHIFTDTLKEIVMNTETHTEEIANAKAAEREFTITDKNYENLPISDGNITLS